IKIGELEGQHFSVQKALKGLYESMDKSEDPVNKLSFTNIDTSIDYELVSTDVKIQNLEKALSTEMFNNSAMNISELEILSNLQESVFANASYDMMKIGDIDGYEEAVKKYLQVGRHHRALGNTLHGTPVTSNQHQVSSFLV
ncbi:31817_t:CDS:2, partial [Gigaspora margarita]